MSAESIHNLKERCRAFRTRSELQAKDGKLYRKVRQMKLESVCFPPPVQRQEWTIEEIVEEVRRYPTRTELATKRPGLYMAIKRRNLTHLLPPSRRGKK